MYNKKVVQDLGPNRRKRPQYPQRFPPPTPQGGVTNPRHDSGESATFSGDNKRAELLQIHCILRVPVASSPLPSRGPTRGQNCYRTTAFSVVPNKEDQIRGGYLTPAFSRANGQEVGTVTLRVTPPAPATQKHKLRGRRFRDRMIGLRAASHRWPHPRTSDHELAVVWVAEGVGGPSGDNIPASRQDHATYPRVPRDKPTSALARGCSTLCICILPIQTRVRLALLISHHGAKCVAVCLDLSVAPPLAHARTWLPRTG